MYKRISDADFFTDLKYHNEFNSQWFWDLEEAKAREREQREKEEHYWARRRVNLHRALHFQVWLKRVEKIDLFKMTAHIEPNFFGEKQAQFDAVKKLHEKKARLIWVLSALHHYLAFDHHLFKQTQNKKLTYSAYRRVYLKQLEKHRENIKQAKWDAKRARVRDKRLGIKRGKKRDTPADVVRKLRGSIHGVPSPVPIIGDTDWD
jgi:hypothetical protein